MAETQNQEKKKKLAVNKRNPIEMGINNNNNKKKYKLQSGVIRISFNWAYVLKQFYIIFEDGATW